MIEANIFILVSRINAVKNTLFDIGNHLDKYLKANEFVELTNDQKTIALAEYDTLKISVVDAWASLIEAENATEEIII